MFKGSEQFEAAKLKQTRHSVQAADAPRLVCGECGHAITAESERITMGGAHQHTFTNPHRVTYRIACFRDAPGCAYVGAATDEFTWFPGYAWRIALCARCGAHLGWLYQKAGSAAFHGLISGQLRAE